MGWESIVIPFAVQWKGPTDLELPRFRQVLVLGWLTIYLCSFSRHFEQLLMRKRNAPQEAVAAKGLVGPLSSVQKAIPLVCATELPCQPQGCGIV